MILCLEAENSASRSHDSSGHPPVFRGHLGSPQHSLQGWVSVAAGGDPLSSPSFLLPPPPHKDLLGKITLPGVGEFSWLGLSKKPGCPLKSSHCSMPLLGPRCLITGHIRHGHLCLSTSNQKVTLKSTWTQIIQNG